MRITVLAVVLLVGGTGLAQARCADEVQDLRNRVDLQTKRHATTQTVAATKELQKADEAVKNKAEVDCYNALARARRALAAPDPVQKVQK